MLSSDSGSISSSQTMTGHGWYPRMATMNISPGETSRRSSGAFFFPLAGVFFLCSGMPAPDLRLPLVAFFAAGVPLVAGASEAGAASRKICQHVSRKDQEYWMQRLRHIGAVFSHLRHRRLPLYLPLRRQCHPSVWVPLPEWHRSRELKVCRVS